MKQKQDSIISSNAKLTQQMRDVLGENSSLQQQIRKLKQYKLDYNDKDNQVNENQLYVTHYDHYLKFTDYNINL
jgi:hypothetical protein